MSFFRSQFGEPWDDDRLVEVPRGGTPVGKSCMHCEKPISAGDQGVVLDAVEQEGPIRKSPGPLHRDCIDKWLPR